MVDWLVITADQAGTGRGVRGYALVWFLQTYFGRPCVAKRKPQQVRNGAAPRAETLFLGLPTSLSPEELQRVFDNIRPRRFVLFDYFDRHDLAWTPGQESVLRQLTDRYFKPWFEPAWEYNLRMGLLPLRTNPRLFAAVAMDRMLSCLGHRPAPRYDVAFLGRPNRTRIIVEGRVVKYDQRIEWLRDLKREAPDLRLWGGLSPGEDPDHIEQLAKYGDFTDLRAPRGKVGFLPYWRALRRSRVLLAPGGNAPWTYRHYECLYAGGVTVTIDFRQRDMLVPLPRDNVIHVADRASVVPAVREALELSNSRPRLAKDNFEYLEQYLHFGTFSRNRRALLDRFLSKLE